MEDAYSHPPFQVEGPIPTPGTSSIVRAIFLTPGPSLRPTPQGGGLGVTRSSLDITNETDTTVSVSSRAENET